MTDRIIVATFQDTNSAYDAATAIKDLKNVGAADFDLKTGVMVRKDELGNVNVVDNRERPLWGTAIGVTTGALIGALAGPAGAVAGGAAGAGAAAAVGAALGGTLGLGGDAIEASLDDDFVDGVTSGMLPGSTALIVEANEGSTRAVDDIVAVNGGNVYRQNA